MNIKSVMIMLILVTFAGSSSQIYAISTDQKNLYKQGVRYYDIEACSLVKQASDASADSLSPGNGPPGGLTFPNLPPSSMALAINTYIANYNKTSGRKSIFTGFGSTFVVGGKKSDVNPFLLVALAQKESQLGSPTDFNVRKGNNAFGRTATSSQPNFQGARLWYFWSSAKASIDPNAPENQRPSGDHSSYIRDVYASFLDSNDLNGFMDKYAPPSENDTALYIKQIKDRMASMVTLAEKNTAGGTTQTSVTAGSTQELASKMLANQNITYWTNNGVNTRDVVVALSKGNKAFTTAPDGQPPETDINPNILKFILEVATEGKIMVNALTDKDHSTGSNHYKGLAVDLDNNPGNTTVATGRLIEIALKFGGTKNEESGHHHFDFLNQPDPTATTSADESTQLTQNTCACIASSQTSLASATSNLPESIPTYWRDLIMNAAPEHPTSDPRLVAAVLWAENRGWPDPNRDWAVSSAGAKGPWQFIDSTWRAMGYDGDGDGVKDPNNPKDSVHSAFIHHNGSLGKPLVEGFTGNVDEFFNVAVFKRDRENLLSFAASYNGSGAPNNTLLKNFPRGQNSDYVRMVYWLIGSDFQKAWHPESNTFRDPAQGAPSGLSSQTSEATSKTLCGNPGQSGDSAGILAGEFAWPVPITYVNSNFQWFTKPHHDYPSADIPVPSGTNIFSITDGKVVYVVPNGYGGGFGVTVGIEYREALFRYQHGINGSVLVKVGDNVKAGQLIMKSGNTGKSTGPHLHVSIETGGTNNVKRTTEHCPQELFKAMKENTPINSFTSLPTTGCIGASL